ncbi:hypothetical protein [Rubrivirga sp. IMCC45206]|uniref:hypothetical protein n=1 Tax=Rubrivirga sp. IMCC45206 TaxID=3391614 RepID=UPI0039902A15
MTLSDAHAQATAESKFFAHLGLFVVGAALATGAGLIWVEPRWVAAGVAAWALVLASHGASVFGHVLGGAWVDRRAAALADAPLVAARPNPADDVLDLFDLAAAAGRRPSGPSPRDAAFADDLSGSDPFGSLRTPIDTPRLDGPAVRV